MTTGAATWPAVAATRAAPEASALAAKVPAAVGQAGGVYVLVAFHTWLDGKPSHEPPDGAQKQSWQHRRRQRQRRLLTLAQQ